MGSVTVTFAEGNRPYRIGNLRMAIVKVTMSNSYATGGDTVSFPDDAGIRRVIEAVGFPASGYVPEYDATNSKIKVYYGDNANASSGPLIEVAALTDLSAVTFTFLVFGV